MTDHVHSDRDQFEAFKALPRDAPVAMLNLVRFRTQAAYPVGHASVAAGLSGTDAYRRCAQNSGPVFARVGGIILWSGRPELVLIGPADERWDATFVAHHPTAAAFLTMVTDPVYQQAVVHRQAAVETSRLVRTAPREAGVGFG